MIRLGNSESMALGVVRSITTRTGRTKSAVGENTTPHVDMGREGMLTPICTFGAGDLARSPAHTDEWSIC